MKMLAAVTTILIVGFSAPALANTYVQCGKSANVDKFEVTDFELAISSEGDDAYTGPVGKKWNLKLGSLESDWLAPNRNITAKRYEDGDDTIIEISIKSGQSVTGGVGTKYKLTGLFDDKPRLEKFTFGGFAGTVKIGTFECVSAND